VKYLTMLSPAWREILSLLYYNKFVSPTGFLQTVKKFDIENYPNPGKKYPCIKIVVFFQSVNLCPFLSLPWHGHCQEGISGAETYPVVRRPWLQARDYRQKISRVKGGEQR
jgi:hypothetical protein